MNTFNTLKTLALCAALAPSAALADDHHDTDAVAAFRAAMAEVGCTVNNQEQADRVEAATGLDGDRLADIVEALMDKGEIVDMNDTGGIKLVTGECAR